MVLLSSMSIKVVLFLGVVILITLLFLYRGVSHTTVLVFGKTTIPIEVADTETKRIQGLSGRDKLKDGTGMFFVFTEEDVYGIWMKDMNFPIDIAWLDKDYRIVDIVHAIDPGTFPQIFYPQEPSLYVLEVNSGFLKKHQIMIGATAQFRPN